MPRGKDLHLVVNPFVVPEFEAIKRERDILEFVREQRPKYPPIAGGATPKWYATALGKIMSGTIDLDTGTFKLMLVTTARAPVQASDATTTDLGANEASGGSGYTTGGWSITPTVTQATLVQKWDCGDISQAITGGPFAFQYGIYYTTQASNSLIGYVDFGSQSITGATLNITNTDPLTITAS